MHVLSIAFFCIPEKARELEHALLGIASTVRSAFGCKQMDVFRNIENHTQVFLLSYWEKRSQLEAFIRSDMFSAILGMKILLSSPQKIIIDHIAKREGIEFISALRSKDESPPWINDNFLSLKQNGRK